MVTEDRSETAWFRAALSAHPVMAILRGYGPRRTLQLAERAWDLGIQLVEVPIQSADALSGLRLVAAAAGERGLKVGAGTVLRVEQVIAARQAGAAFTVSPGLDPDVVSASRDQGLPTLPGVATATEIQRADQLGIAWMKAFPATALGTEWFRGMRGPFPQARFVATGGIDADNAAAYLAAGAAVLGVGSALEDERQLDALARLTPTGLR